MSERQLNRKARSSRTGHYHSSKLTLMVHLLPGGTALGFRVASAHTWSLPQGAHRQWDVSSNSFILISPCTADTEVPRA